MIGTFVSQLTWMREANGVLNATKGLTQTDLDVLFDANANSIGALMLHLAATEVYYGLHTFEGMKWDSWPDDVKKKWDPAMNLGDAGRKTIKGHDRDYYVGILHGSWLPTRVGRGAPPTISASGSTSANMKPITPARSRSCASASPEPNPEAKDEDSL